MQRIDAPEILDSDGCTLCDTQAALRVIGRINRWFGGIATTQNMVERVARATQVNHFSLLEVASGLGEVPRTVGKNLEDHGITLDITLLDVARSHLPHIPAGATTHRGKNRGVVGDALSLPFEDDSFDLVSCSLFAHHLNPARLARFLNESLRVSRRALLINDLIRDPLHLALVYASFPIMLNRVAWLDGLTSVRRAYTLSEIRHALNAAFTETLLPQVELSRHYLFRMGVIVWKRPVG
jgi:ubiquinone/menaquinone biosynthesis C-methylase UbiE